MRRVGTLRIVVHTELQRSFVWKRWLHGNVWNVPRGTDVHGRGRLCLRPELHGADVRQRRLRRNLRVMRRVAHLQRRRSVRGELHTELHWTCVRKRWLQCLVRLVHRDADVRRNRSLRLRAELCGTRVRLRRMRRIVWYV